MLDVDLEIVEAATALVRARTDGSYHTTAAAARTMDGRVLSGINVFHFTGGPCAELVVIGEAAARGLVGSLRQIVAVGDNERGVLSPCGRCRQVLFDLCPKIEVIVSDGDSKLQAVAIADLLPWSNPWRAETGTLPN
jgi:cytidine deaminase